MMAAVPSALARWSTGPDRSILSLVNRRRGAPGRGAIPMSIHTPVCELLGIEHPVVQAPVAADPRLPAAVSNAGGLGSLGLGWSKDAGVVVRETAALTARASRFLCKRCG